VGIFVDIGISEAVRRADARHRSEKRLELV
jgi:hypothetical protein